MGGEAMRGLQSTKLGLVAVLLLLSACGTPSRISAVPDGQTTRATIPNIPNARYWADADPAPFLRDALAAVEREKAYLAEVGHQGPLPPVNFLAVSGGGDNGAFGAGLLVGWSKAGNRPEFKGVTGISTGALIAPFAFLGEDYDDELQAVYTTVAPGDIYEPRGLLAALIDDALADSAPLLETVTRYADEEMLRRIGEEYMTKGRLLMVATTDLDARRPVIWNMGAIAASGAPNALPLFRKILVASASIPGAFPPVMVDVEVNGEPHQEMHVDGGAMAQVFVYPPGINVAELSEKNQVQRERTLYVIRNARLDPEWSTVERQTLTIAGRAISSLIHSQGIGDLYRIYVTTQRDGFDYNLAYIGSEFEAEKEEEFETAFMQALFGYGFDLAQDGYPWRKTPPGFEARN